MEDKLNKGTPVNNEEKQYKLDDERRVKVLSPGMLVIKRFLRNKLAIVGLVILAAMFLFSFAGALFTPYSQSQVFKHDEITMKDYASAIYNEELRYYMKEGAAFSAAAKSQAMLAVVNGSAAFSSDGMDYNILDMGNGSYTIGGNVAVANITTLANRFNVKALEGVSLTVTDEFVEACREAVDTNASSFTFDDVQYVITRDAKTYNVFTVDTIGVATVTVFDAYDLKDSALVDSFEFRLAAEKAFASGTSAFKVGDNAYAIQTTDEGTSIHHAADATPLAAVSDILVSAIADDIVLNYELKTAIRDAVTDHKTKFTYNGENFEISRVNKTYGVKTNTVTRLITMYEAPSTTHVLGTDGNGMDILARLMYGGRISLMVGFVVIFLEVFLGVMIGGISGYFGGWVDTILMRFVDLFNCIPFYPTVMIIGAAMDRMDVEPIARIFLLMAVLGILGWTSIARVVRGQILSLREQDFMTAAEAGGISISRRIFKHLVPNVMPLLIVQATMGLGGIIITEATLSFLGLGVKYPLASWGSMINAANSVHVMTNYWFIWIPAGLLIVLTVLGFNFVGDGLRDAFDPKMKR